MKNLIKKTTATFILLTIFTISALADETTQCQPTPPPCGDMQCPVTCSTDESTPDTTNDKDQESDDLTDIILRMFEKIGFLF